MISKSRFKNTHVHIAVTAGLKPIQNIFFISQFQTSAHARNARAGYYYLYLSLIDKQKLGVP